MVCHVEGCVGKAHPHEVRQSLLLQRPALSLSEMRLREAAASGEELSELRRSHRRRRKKPFGLGQRCKRHKPFRPSHSAKPPGGGGDGKSIHEAPNQFLAIFRQEILIITS